MRKPAALLDIDVTHTFPGLDDLHGHDAAHVMFRLHGRPFAWTTADVPGGRLDPDTLIRILLERHAWGCAIPLAERAVSGGAPPRYLDVPGLLQVPPPRRSGGPLVTVAICNTAPADVLQICLQALAAGDYRNIDLLVLDGSDHGPAIEALLRDRMPGVRYVREPDRMRMGRRAVIECQGDILALTEGDAVPDRGWVSALVHAFLADPEVMMATGPILPRRLEAPFSELTCALPVCRRWLRLHGRLLTGAPGAPGRRGANIAWWRSALEPDRATDRRGGFTLVYEPSALVRTDAARPFDQLVEAPVRTPALECPIDLADGLRPIDARSHEALSLHVRWDGRPLGVARTVGGGVVSPLQITDAIAQQLTAAVLDAGLGVGEQVCRALITADLARFMVSKRGGSLQWAHGHEAHDAVA